MVGSRLMSSQLYVQHSASASLVQKWDSFNGTERMPPTQLNQCQILQQFEDVCLLIIGEQ